MKQRFSYLDLRLISNEITAELKECRLQNIYSLEASARHFLLKFDAKDGAGKRFLIVDPGYRLHITKFQHDVTTMPSQFVSKLRKHLKTRRASNFWVAPGSRLMVVTFSEGQFYLVFEFFSGGNMILLDSTRKILSLFRVVKGPGVASPCVIGGIYELPGELTAPSTPLPPDTSMETIKRHLDNDKDRIGKILYSRYSEPSSSMLEYCLRDNGIDPKEKATSSIDYTAVKKAIDTAVEWARKLIDNTCNKGYILRNVENKDQQVALEFEPFSEYYEQEIARTAAKDPSKQLKIEEHPSYNETADAYFGDILSDKQASKIDQLYSVAESRLTAARSERANRVKSLEEVQRLNEKRGMALQLSHELADAAIQAVKSLIDQGMDWGDAAQLLKLEQSKKNPVAESIVGLDLAHSKVTLKLPDADDEENSDMISVDVRLDQSAHANARNYYDVKRAATSKKEKTEQHANKALKSAEHKIKKDLEKNLAKSSAQSRQLHMIRQPYWFEKFYWFLCSDTPSTLVIAGRDELQNNLLLRRYFTPGNLLVYSDGPEASLLIIKNLAGKEPSPQALSQSAVFCAASCPKTWSSGKGAVTYYLTRSQVPKLNSSGDPISVRDIAYLPNRVSMPPTPLDMGLAILWQVDSSALENLPTKGESAEPESDSSDDSDAFPDTRFDSDEELFDTYIDSDPEAPVQRLESPDTPSPAPEPEDSGTEKPESTEGTEMEETPQTVRSAATTSAGTEGAQISTNPDTDDAQSDSSSSSSSEALKTQSSPDPGVRKPTKKVRGGKKKLRKYMEQDEEDRKSAMERLGTLKGLQRQAEERRDHEEKKRQQLEQQQLRRRKAREAELARISNDESEPTPDPVDLRLTYPKTEKVLAAVPMFGPWQSMRNVEHKIKMTPGPLKKGKAVKESLQSILGPSPSNEQVLLLEALKQPTVQGAISVSQVRLGVGASKSGKDSKNGAKGGAKNGKSKK